VVRSKSENEERLAKQSERLTLTLDWPEITLAKLSRVAGIWAEIVQGVTKTATGSSTSVKWVIAEISFSSPLQVVAAPRRVSSELDPKVVERISAAVVEGIEHLDHYGDRPPLFSDPVLHGVRRLARFSDTERAKTIHVSNGKDERAQLGTRVAANVEDLFGPVVESYGSVEGRLEGVFVHNTRRFFVFDSLTNKQVRCDFTDDISLREILDAFEKRVAVTGLVRARAKTGERLSIRAHMFRVFRSDDELTPTDRILEEWRRQ
jgi:hypothetical protein